MKAVVPCLQRCPLRNLLAVTWLWMRPKIAVASCLEVACPSFQSDGSIVAAMAPVGRRSRRLQPILAFSWYCSWLSLSSGSWNYLLCRWHSSSQDTAIAPSTCLESCFGCQNHSLIEVEKDHHLCTCWCALSSCQRLLICLNLALKAELDGDQFLYFDVARRN